MTSKASSVKDYVAEVPAERKPAIAKLRALCRRHHGVAEVGFASQKQNIGKGCIRFTKPEKIDFEVVGRLLSRTAESEEAPC